jgi:hypothetical protein
MKMLDWWDTTQMEPKQFSCDAHIFVGWGGDSGCLGRLILLRVFGEMGAFDGGFLKLLVGLSLTIP